MFLMQPIVPDPGRFGGHVKITWREKSSGLPICTPHLFPFDLCYLPNAYVQLCFKGKQVLGI